MENASHELPPIPSFPNGLSVYFLTGKKYLYQTLFCARSLINTKIEDMRFILVDDGSFDTVLVDRICQQMPGVTIITQQQIEQNLQKNMPVERYPVLHEKRKVYPHIKKLTDIHTIPGNEWKLVLDSDMLFWDQPLAIINWLRNPEKPVYMQDCQNSYGYSMQLMARLCGSSIPDLLNVGVIGLNSKFINWDKLEEWVGTLEKEEGTSYYLEQALTAMLIGENDCTILPAAEYIVNPVKDSVYYGSGVLHHYVDLSKELYFKYAWKKV